jgi:hypothetical protein
VLAHHQPLVAHTDAAVEDLAEELHLLHGPVEDVGARGEVDPDPDVLRAGEQRDAGAGAHPRLGPHPDEPHRGAQHHLAVGVGVDHVGGHEVGGSHELGDELRRGLQVDVARRGLLDDLPGGHHRDPGRHGQRLGLVVGHVERGDPELALEVAQLRAHAIAQGGVEVGQRLVEEQQLRPAHQGPGQGQPLLLATGELGGVAALEPAEADDLEGLAHSPSDLLRAEAATEDAAPGEGRSEPHVSLLGRRLEHRGGEELCLDLVHAATDLALAGGPQREGHVLEGRHVRPDGVGLEHHPDVATVRGHEPRPGRDRLAGQADAAGVGPLEAGDAPQGGRLPAARGAEQRVELALLDREGHVPDGVDVVPPVGEHLAQAVDDEGVGAVVAPLGRRAGTGVSSQHRCPRRSASGCGRRPGT